MYHPLFAVVHELSKGTLWRFKKGLQWILHPKSCCKGPQVGIWQKGQTTTVKHPSKGLPFTYYPNPQRTWSKWVLHRLWSLWRLLRFVLPSFEHPKSIPHYFGLLLISDWWYTYSLMSQLGDDSSQFFWKSKSHAPVTSNQSYSLIPLIWFMINID